MNADQTIVKIRHTVLYHVAKLAFEGRLEEEYQYIPEIMLPGPLPSYRCCVYREREVVRNRVRLAMGKAPEQIDNGNLIQVIDAACSDCPISGYLVTENCQNCVGKACLHSCKFGAITLGKTRTEIDKQKCKECGMCARVCPYQAIIHMKRPCKASCPVDALEYDEYGLAAINGEKCISCGQCIHSCPFGAIGTKNDIVPVIEHLKSDRPVFVMFAPATEGQFGRDITMASFRKAAKEVGFTDMIEVGLGADLTTRSEAMEWHEAYEKGEMKTTSCCPAFVNLINKHYPELADNMSTSVSPMCQLSRLLKAKYPGAVTVFVGPCIAKKSEIRDQKIEGNVDYALIYSEFEAMMKAKGVTLEPAENDFQRSSKYGKGYATSGGVTDSCIAYLKEQGIEDDLKVLKVSGTREIKKALNLAKAGKLEEQFIEGMACEGGCFYGPSGFDHSVKAKNAREAMISQADDRTINENLSEYDLSKFSSHRE